MHQTADILLALGLILLLGLATNYLGRHSFLPRVTLLLILGMLIGPHALNLLPETIHNHLALITSVALLMVGFLLGGKITREALQNSGRQLLWISITAAAGTSLVVFFGLILAGASIEIAVLLACIASATAPAATMDVVNESGIDNRFANLLLSIVAVDDAWALILFSIGVAIVTALNGAAGLAHPLMSGFSEIGGAVILGIGLGLPGAYLTGRIKPGQPTLLEALGLVFLCGGIALWLEVSFLIAAITMGSIVANYARHHEYAFHEIENVESPFMVIFFVLAGASLDINNLKALGLIGISYIVLRILGKIICTRAGAVLSRSDKTITNWMGIALLPQAGVAIGMALLAANQFPEYEQTLLTVAISTTVFFEILGPVATRLALRKSENKPVNDS